MINIAICDDEKFMSDELSGLLYEFFSPQNIEIKICQFTNGSALLKSNKPLDLIFLDIRMNGTNGMDVAEIIKAILYLLPLWRSLYSIPLKYRHLIIL